MLDDKDTYRVMQYEKPPLWMQVLAYMGMVGLFAGAFLGNVWALSLLAGWALYWNYKLFEIIKAYVNYVNATEINNLMAKLVAEELNKQKDGTIPERDGLTKETGDEENPDG